jgi:hypothetical protein
MIFASKGRETGNPNALSIALRKLISDSNLRNEMGIEAAKKAEQSPDREHVYDFFNSLISG